MVSTKELFNETTATQRARASHLEWVPLGSLVPSPKGQRKFVPSWADYLAAHLEIEKIGFPVVSHRDDVYYIVDGQHRVAALKIFGFPPEDTIQCEVYDGLSEQEEAELFLGRSDVKMIHPVDKFEIAVNASRTLEVSIDHLVKSLGVSISRYRSRLTPNVICATGALKDIAERMGLRILERTLRVIQSAYGNHALDATTIKGVAMFLYRYDQQVDDEKLIERLASVPGGLNGLLGPAEKTHLALSQPRKDCIAAEITEIYNRGQARGSRIAPWWAE